MSATGFSLQVVTEARSAARKLGILRPLALLRVGILKKLGKGHYEEEFDEALRQAIKFGDVVWDVGANVGLYTAKFAEWVGSGGQVIAFEPVPTCFEELSRRIEGSPQASAMQRALGDTDRVSAMNMSNDPLSANHSFAGHDQGTRVISVQVNRGDSLIHQLSLRTPNVIKIDVEGFEEEVLIGLGEVLNDPRCRAVLIEVHFGILEQRGKRQAPVAICKRLIDAGFKLKWTDSSHLAAMRAM